MEKEIVREIFLVEGRPTSLPPSRAPPGGLRPQWPLGGPFQAPKLRGTPFGRVGHALRACPLSMLGHTRRTFQRDRQKDRQTDKARQVCDNLKHSVLCCAHQNDCGVTNDSSTAPMYYTWALPTRLQSETLWEGLVKFVQNLTNCYECILKISTSTAGSTFHC